MGRLARAVRSSGGLLLAALLAAMAPVAASSQPYPSRPIRIIIPYTAGGVAETIVRLLAVQMEKRLGQKLVVEARPGALGNIGAGEVARAEPDGYTLLVAATNNFVINQHLVKMAFDPVEALVPIAKLAEVPLVMFSSPAIPPRSFRELVDYVRANPGKLNYGTPSPGTVNHLFVERLKQTLGLDLVHVPFRGSPQAVLALLSNDIQLFPIGYAAAAGQHKDGKIEILGVAATSRLPLLPNVSTVIEQGFPDARVANWWGMAAPSATPDSAIDLLAGAVVEALKDRTVIERFTALGMLVPTETRAQFAASIRADAATWKETVRVGGITVQ